MTAKKKARAAPAPAPLFEDHSAPAAVADRAQATSIETRAKSEALATATAHVDIRKPAEPVPHEYITATNHMIAGIQSKEDVDLARQRWEHEARLRDRIGVDLKDVRLLKAALDGRCNRVLHGDMQAKKGRKRANTN